MRKAEDDAGLDRLLRAALQPSGAGTTGDCPDAADLAAFAEGACVGSEREALETHFAGCEKCQAALAMLADLPPVGPSARPAWHRRFLASPLRWLVPATAAASAVVLYLVVLQPRDTRTTPVAPAVVASRLKAPDERQGGDVQERQPAKENHAAEASATHAAARPTPKALALVRPDSGTGALADKAGEARRTGQVTARSGALPAAAPPSTPVDALQAKAPTPSTELQIPADAGKTSAPQRTAVAGGIAGGVAGGVVGGIVAAEPPPKNLATPVTQAEKPSARAEQVIAAERPAAPTFRAAVAAVVSPEGRARWYLGERGGLVRSLDGGVAQHQESGTTNDLLAGSAPSVKICWLVGRQGTVLRTIDGETWQSCPFPEKVDLVSITASDAQSATVTARDGRRFLTSNGGATWTLTTR